MLDIKPRSMTRKEVREMRDAGADPAMRTDLDRKEYGKLSAEMIDWILDNVYSGHDFDDTDYCELVQLAEDTYQITMGQKVQEDEAKNS